MQPFRGVSLLLMALVLAPGVAGLTAPPGAQVMLAPAELGQPDGPCAAATCVDLPFVVDENGDAMDGPLTMNADLRIAGGQAVAFAGGSLRGDAGLSFGGVRVCLEAAPAPGCGDVTGVAAGFGLLGGGSVGAISLAANDAVLQRRVASPCAEGTALRAIAQDGSVACQAASGWRCDEGAALREVFADGSVACQAATGWTCPAGWALREVLADGSVACEQSTGWVLGGNAGTDAATNFLGTRDATALQVRVNGSRALLIEPTATPNLIGGHPGNAALAGVLGATVAGGGGFYYTIEGERVIFHGGGEGSDNVASDHFATVSGGSGNLAGDGDPADLTGYLATVAGGWNNTASGSLSMVGGGNLNRATDEGAVVGGGYKNVASDAYATIAGGFLNEASAYSAAVGGGVSNRAAGERSVVAGGDDNLAAGEHAAVGGGTKNEARGVASTVAGGFGNHALGNYSFGAGRFARATHDGAFVWADGTATTFASNATNSFRVRATGGAGFVSAVSGTTPTAGVYLAPGGGSWTSLSDRALKHEFEAIDARSVLARVAAMPLSEWSYTAQPGVRHIGPMAQDFRAAFGLGVGDTGIDTVDADGVALAAIQGLYELVQEQARALAELRAEVEQLKAQDD